MNGYLSGLESMRQKVDSVPYENFPYCCSSDNTLKKEMDMARSQNLVPKQQGNDLRDQQRAKQQTPPRESKTFWTIPVIEKYSNTKSCHSSTQHYDQNGQLTYGKEINKKELREKNKLIAKRYQEVREELQSEAQQEYDNNRNEQDPEFVSYDQYQEMLQQINYDIAW